MLFTFTQVSIIEKAYAKCYGSYGAICSGTMITAMEDLTGAPCERIDFEVDDTAMADKVTAYSICFPGV